LALVPVPRVETLPEPVAGFGGYFVVQPLEPGIIDVFRRDLGEKVRIANVLSDHLLDCATVFRVGLHDQDHFSLFHYLFFFTVCAGNWKPIGANRQPLFQQGATDLACLVSSIECDIIDSHNKNSAVGIATLSAHQIARRNELFTILRLTKPPSSVHLQRCCCPK
jgi:hypothetical protein